MCYKTLLAFLTVAVSVISADYVYHPGVTDDKPICIPCGPKPHPHVYLPYNFTFDSMKASGYRLIYTNDLPPEANQECIHWTTYPYNDDKANINRCWNNKYAHWMYVDCGRHQGSGNVTYSRPELTKAAFYWESGRWSGQQEYFVIHFEHDMFILLRCETVRGKATQYVYVLSINDLANPALAKRVNDVLKFNSMNPAQMKLKVISHWDCNYLNQQLLVDEKKPKRP